MDQLVKSRWLTALAVLMQVACVALLIRSGQWKSDLLFIGGFIGIILGTLWLLSVFLIPQFEPNFPWRRKHDNPFDDTKTPR
jgi:fatty acid desaturase